MQKIEDFYFSHLKRIQAEIEMFDKLISHNGEKGSENESLLKDFLISLLPKKLSVGTGFIVDSNGCMSKQCDIIIYDSLYSPNLIQFRENTIFPIECVYAVIEVKTTITNDCVEKAFEALEVLRSMNFNSERVMFFPSVAPKAQSQMTSTETSPPLYFIFGYRTLFSEAEKIFEIFKKHKTKPFPEASCILDSGIIKIETLESGERELNFYVPHVQKEGKDVVYTGNKKEHSENGISYKILQKRTDKGVDTKFLVNSVDNLIMFVFMIHENLSKKSMGKDYLKYYFPLDRRYLYLSEKI